MKTTVDLPDDLLILAKVHAARQRKTLKEIIEVALRKELNRDPHSSESPKGSIRWITVPGGLPKEIDIANRETWYSLYNRSL
jgi:hypothetical protein